jgi:hypothetical protein
MTSLPAVRPTEPDWKVSTAYRVLIIIGWGACILALYSLVIGLVLGFPTAWWMAAAFALAALALSGLLPEPVPAEMIIDKRTRVETTSRR